MYTVGRALESTWVEENSRLRYKWRTSCKRCKLFVHASLCVSDLRAFTKIQYLLQSSCQISSRTQWLELIPPPLRIPYAPNAHDDVVFYKSALAQSECTDAVEGVCSTWGGKTSDEISGDIIQCRVESVSYFSCGPLSSPQECCPFVLVHLKKNAESVFTTHIVHNLKPARQPSLTLVRLLTRALGFIKQSPDAEHFIQPVSKEEYPDYYNVVRYPVCLSMIEKKIKSYKSVEEFKSSLILMRDNCVLFCADRYPDIIDMAERLLEYGLKVLNRLKKELDEAEMNIASAVRVENAQDIESKLEDEDANKGIESAPDDGGEEEFSVCVRLNARWPSCLVSKDQYNSGIEIVRSAELESKCRVRSVSVNNTAVIKQGVYIGHRDHSLFIGRHLSWQSLKVEWVDEATAPGELCFINPWDVFEPPHWWD